MEVREVRAVRVYTPLPGAPGEYVVHFDEQGQPNRLTFACPCGCPAIGAVTLQPADPHGWAFNGNIEKPTCSPSIWLNKPYGWHGHLEDGVFEPCAGIVPCVS